MSTNYKPWEISINDFFSLKTEEEKLRFLINFAVLAPSSHNSQPWYFSVKDNSVLVFPDLERALRVGDKQNRLLYISIGCAIRNIFVAADFYNLQPEITFPDNQNTPNCAATISFSGDFNSPRSSPGFLNDHLIFSIMERSVNRGKYKPMMPPKSFLEKIESLSSSNLKIFLVSDAQRKNNLAELSVESSVELMESNKFRTELSHYVKNNLTKSPLGIPVFGMGIPTPLSFFVSTLIKHLNMEKLTKMATERILKDHTPVFLVFATKTDSVHDWIQVGQSYQQIALMAEKEKNKTAVWASPIVSERFRRNVQDVLGTSLKPQLVSRLGYPEKKQPHSPRLSASQVIR